MNAFRCAGAAMVAAVMTALGPGQAAAASANQIPQARLESLEYQSGVLSEQDAKAFLVVTGATPTDDPLSAGAFQANVCGQAVTSKGTSVAGRQVDYQPNENTYLQDAVVGFDTSAHATAFLQQVTDLVAGCHAPYSYPNSAGTFLPGTNPAPTLPKVGDQRVVDTALVTIAEGTPANLVQVGVRNGQFINFAFMDSVAAITPTIVKSVTTAMGNRLTRIQQAAATKQPHSNPKAFANLSCNELLTSPQLTAALGVAFQNPTDCSFALVEGAGGVDVTFTAAANGGRDTYARLASGQPVDVKGAADALYKTDQNQLGQTTETVYVLTDNGDTFSISLRGDDAPKNQQAQLTKAATTAMKRLQLKS